MPSSVPERKKALEEMANDILELGAAMLVSTKIEERSAYDTAELEEMLGATACTMLALILRASIKCDADAMKVIKLGMDLLEQASKRRPGR